MAQRVRAYADFTTGAWARPQPRSHKTEEQPVTNHDLHATLLYLLGMDHKRLTDYFNGRNMRLTDVAGELIPQIVNRGASSKA